MSAHSATRRLRSSILLGGVVAALLTACTPLQATAVAGKGSTGATVQLSASATAMSNSAVKFAADVVDTLTAQKSRPPADGTTPQKAAAVIAGLPFRPTLTCARCNSGPAVAAAAIYAATKVVSRKNFAIKTIDLLIKAQQQPNGALANYSTSADIDTMFDADNIGMATLLLKPALDAAHVKSWTAAVAGGADYLIANGNTRWYTNGNIVVGNALTFALAYKLTGLAKYQTAYQAMLAFAIAPPQNGMWAGYGFVTTKAPMQANGSDGKGYFTEAGYDESDVLHIGYDPDYTMLQSDQLARLYLVTKSPQVLRLLNMVTNQLLANVNPTTSMMPGIGTRKKYSSEFFDSAAPTVLAYLGGRADLKTRVTTQLALTATRWGQDVRRMPLGDRGYYAIGMIPVSILIATGKATI